MTPKKNKFENTRFRGIFHKSLILILNLWLAKIEFDSAKLVPRSHGPKLQEPATAVARSKISEESEALRGQSQDRQVTGKPKWVGNTAARPDWSFEMVREGNLAWQVSHGPVRKEPNELRDSFSVQTTESPAVLWLPHFQGEAETKRRYTIYFRSQRLA